MKLSELLKSSLLVNPIHHILGRNLNVLYVVDRYHTEAYDHLTALGLDIMNCNVLNISVGDSIPASWITLNMGLEPAQDIQNPMHIVKTFDIIIDY